MVLPGVQALFGFQLIAVFNGVLGQTFPRRAKRSSARVGSC